MTELKTVKTRKEHVCEFCKKVIPKGSEAIVLQQEGYGGYWIGNDYFSRHKYYRRVYWHKECYAIQEIVGKIDKFRSDFHVYRTLGQVVYLIRGKEIVIDLEPKARSFTEIWNKTVKKSNEIYEFMRINGLLTYPELDLRRMEDKIDD